MLLASISLAILETMLDSAAPVCAMRPRMFAGQVVTLLCERGAAEGAWFVNGRYAGHSAETAAVALGAAILESCGAESWASESAPTVATLASTFFR